MYHLKNVAIRQYKNKKYMPVYWNTQQTWRRSNDRYYYYTVSSILYLKQSEYKLKIQQAVTSSQRINCSGAVKLSNASTNVLAKVKLEDKTNLQ